MALFSLAKAAPDAPDTSPCCNKYPKSIFPNNIVKSYFRTSSICNLPSIVFIFNNGLSSCADPNAQWVKDLMKYLDNKNKPTS
ncbi:C-C motif chemokine 5-like [Podarcis lilfordi]|uniref:C-C motif chemokine 5-like n=1 Tax=Podarcis lilfordi TaxID=74358 RepID=A0AA35LFP4_9SAUR|nr:C-C motif chemokine 5-like [Podarcis lilfordi]